jgi:release factor glutamine methyltransferase
MLRRRLRHEPLQYILGRWDFCDLTLRVRSPCLCPRPETEELVDLAALDVARALALAQTQAQTPGRKRVRVLDVGCGSGAVGLALASRFGTAVDVTAIDVEPMAVELANENALEVLGGEASYRAVLCGADEFGGPKFDVVVSNPPYIPRADMAGLAADVVGYEADEALCGGEDGLDVVRAIVRRLPDWAAGGGCTCWMEVDTSHPALIERWLGGGATGDGAEGGATGVHFCEGVRDLCGRDRFVKLRVPPRGSQERNGNHEINAY